VITPDPQPRARASWMFVFDSGFHKGVLGLLFAALCLPPVSTATSSHSKKQEKPYALIFGTVWAPDDYPLYGIKVKIRRASEKKTRWEVYSDHRGEFALRVPPGPADYLVGVDLKGLKPKNGKPLRLEQEVKVHIYNDEREDIGVHLKQ